MKVATILRRRRVLIAAILRRRRVLIAAILRRRRGLLVRTILRWRVLWSTTVRSRRSWGIGALVRRRGRWICTSGRRCRMLIAALMVRRWSLIGAILGRLGRRIAAPCQIGALETRLSVGGWWRRRRSRGRKSLFSLREFAAELFDFLITFCSHGRGQFLVMVLLVVCCLSAIAGVWENAGSG